jgi:protein gp37
LESGVAVVANRIDWVIVGGESGPGARPMHPDWARSLRDQCQEAGVPFLFKQFGEWAPHRTVAGGDEGGDIRRGHVRYLQGDGREPDGHFRKGDAAVARVGKKAAGRLLDGREWNGYPPT